MLASFLPLPGGQCRAQVPASQPMVGDTAVLCPSTGIPEDLGTQRDPQPMTGEGGLGKGSVSWLGWGPANRRGCDLGLETLFILRNPQMSPCPSPKRRRGFQVHMGGEWEHSIWLLSASGLEATLEQSTRPPIRAGSEYRV